MLIDILDGMFYVGPYKFTNHDNSGLWSIKQIHHYIYEYNLRSFRVQRLREEHNEYQFHPIAYDLFLDGYETKPNYEKAIFHNGCLCARDRSEIAGWDARGQRLMKMCTKFQVDIFKNG